VISDNNLKDFREKVEKLREVIRNKNAKGLIINNQNHFSWLTGGRGFIGLAATAACGSLVLTLDAVYLVAENIEVARLYKEQLSENPDVVVREYPWHIPGKRNEIINEICETGALLNEDAVSKELYGLRTVMSAYDIERYRDICKTTAEVLEDICHTLKEGMSEYELAGQVSQAMWANNLEPITLLIAFDERALQYRHPVPTEQKLKNYALIAVCTRRSGLIASITRMVAIKHPGEEMMRRQRVAAFVEATLISNTKQGRNVGDIFDKAVDAYTKEGFEGEWEFHHQGGLTGYAPRELKGMSNVNHTVRINEVYAWNPSVQGAKAENTILVTEDGYENLTHTDKYAYITFEIDGSKYLEENILILNQ
jgi:Xaa-Pro dipeptidase